MKPAAPVEQMDMATGAAGRRSAGEAQREAELRRQQRSRAIAWSLVALVIVFFLGTGIRIAGAAPTVTNLMSGALVIVAVLLPGLIFTVPLRAAWALSVLLTIAAVALCATAGQPLISKGVILLLALIVNLQMLVRSRAAARGDVREQ